MNTTITTKLEWHPSHFNYILVLKKLENTSQTQHCSIALKCNMLVFTMNMKLNMSIWWFVFYFSLKSGEFWSFFGSKFLCIGWNHNFQVQIWRNFTQKKKHCFGGNSGLHAKLLRTWRSSPTKREGFVNSHDAILSNNMENMWESFNQSNIVRRLCKSWCS
jgi:hypothetical protein